MARKMRDIMSPAPVCMAPGESVSAAAKAMKQHGIGTVLVLTVRELLDRHGRLYAETRASGSPTVRVLSTSCSCWPRC